MTQDNKKFEELIKKIQKAKQSGSLDLSLEEDLSIAIMNLISLEEHFFFTASKTGKPEYFDLLNEARNIRKSLLARMIKNSEGEVWCISKHLLAGSMRLIEVGTKYLSEGKKKDAEEVFGQAYNLYSLFWAVRLKLVDVKPFLREDAEKGKAWSFEDIVNKLVDCCEE